MAFYCDTLFGYTNKREYMGGMNFRNVVTLQAQRVYSANDSTPPVGMPPLWTGAYTGIVVNGVNFGSGRLMSFSNPVSNTVTEDGRHLWKQNVTVEIIQTGSNANLSASQETAGLSDVIKSYLLNFDESYNFDISSNGDYQYSHSASVRCTNDIANQVSGYILAQRLASGLLTSTPPFGYIDSVHSGYYNLALGQRYFTETTDIYEGVANFEERFVIQSRDFVKHDVSFTNGVMTVTENVSFRHSGVSKVEDVFGNAYNMTTRATLMLNGAYTRCNGLYTTYRDALGTDAYETNLVLQPTQLTKTFDERSQEFNYSISYSNNPIMLDTDYSIDREIVVNSNSENVVTATENATLTVYTSKGVNVPASLSGYLATEANADTVKNRIATYYPDSSAFKKISDSRSLNSYGKRATYSLAFTNDPSFINDGTFLSKTINIQDTPPTPVHQAYVILGKPSPLMHAPMLTNFGSVSTSINAKLVKPANYSIATPWKPRDALNSLFVEALNQTLSKISESTPSDLYIRKVSYSYDANLNVQMVVEGEYVYPRTTNV